MGDRNTSDGLSAGHRSSEMDALSEDNNILEEVNDEEEEGEDLLENMHGCVCNDIVSSRRSVVLPFESSFTTSFLMGCIIKMRRSVRVPHI